MKCIKCETDNNLKDRTANRGRCISCGHPFVFDPMVMDKPLTFTDIFFEKAIIDLSANGTLFFTDNQFYYFVNRRLKQRTNKFSSLGWWGIYLFLGFWFNGIFQDDVSGLIIISLIFNISLILFFLWQSSDRATLYPDRLKATTNLIILGSLIIFGGFLYINMTGYFSFLLSLLVGIGSIYLGQRQRTKIKNSFDFLVDRQKFNAWLNQWTRVNQEITELLPSPQAESQPATINPNITNYSFDRLVVCDNSSIAQMLIANNFHFENNCAILSITGYPQRIFNPVMEMLRRNPDLKVYAFHNASPRGVGLVHHLQTSENWFAEQNATIYDLGLLPRQILKNPKMFIRYSEESANEAQEIPEAVRQGLSADEITWLEAGNFVELESFGPKKLMQVLSQGIAMSREASISSGGTSLVSFGADDSYDSSSSAIYFMSSDTFG